MDDRRISREEDLLKLIDEWGFVPFFANQVKGFSLEEHADAGIWFPDQGEGVWEWKGPVIRQSGCAYGKFFAHKAAFISQQWFMDFANYRRDGYDFDARFDDGLASYRDKELYDLVAGNAPILSRRLKKIGRYQKGGRKGFDTIINRLQAQGYVIISDFVYDMDRYGQQYGWGVAQYSTPEQYWGPTFTENVYQRTPEQSFERIRDHLSQWFDPQKLDEWLK